MQWEKTPKIPIKRPKPYWLDNINVTPELIYRYQISTRTLNDVLNDDMYALKHINQVNMLMYINILISLIFKYFKARFGQ
jgi:hypothetical protein